MFHRLSNGSSPLNNSAPSSTSPRGKAESICSVQQLQLQTSTESLADLQPAAPEVVLPQQSPSASLMTKEDNTSVVPLKTESDKTSNVGSVQEAKLAAKTVEKGSSASLPITSPGTVDEKPEEKAGNKFLKVNTTTFDAVSIFCYYF